jgi:hypothetical protein
MVSCGKLVLLRFEIFTCSIGECMPRYPISASLCASGLNCGVAASDCTRVAFDVTVATPYQLAIRRNSRYDQERHSCMSFKMSVDVLENVFRSTASCGQLRCQCSTRLLMASNLFGFIE